MSDFVTALNSTLKWEGTYSNHPADRGGETILGISRKNWPNWIGWTKVDKLKKPVNSVPQDLFEDIKQFYFNAYWLDVKCDKINSDKLAAFLFDTAVNIGCNRASRYLQEAVNLLNKNDIEVDGNIGRVTVDAVNSLKEDRILIVYKALRVKHYIDICRVNPSHTFFLYGWLVRCMG